MDDQKPLESLLDMLDEVAGGEETDLRSVIMAFDDRAFGPVLILCGLFLLTPLGIIPGVPTALAVIIISFAGQLLFGRDHPWMPDFIGKVKIKDATIKKTKEKAGPWLSRVDGLIKPRMKWAAGGFARTIAALISVILAVTMIPLNFVPFGVVIPGLVVCILGLGITARDGVIMLLGFTLSAGAAGLIAYLVM